MENFNIKPIALHGQVVVNPLGWLDHYAPGIFVPTEYQHPRQIGEVIGVAPMFSDLPTVAKVGDIVAYEVENPGDISEDAFIRYTGYHSGSIIMYEPQIAAIIDKEHYKEGMKMKDLEYDKVTLVGTKMYVRFIEDKDISKDDQGNRINPLGIILPDRNLRKEVAVGEIMNISPLANSLFFSDELKVGDIVMFRKHFASMRIKEARTEDIILICNSHDAIARMKGDEWEPIGDNIFLSEVSVKYELKEVESEDESTLIIGAKKKIKRKMWVARDGKGLPLVENTNKRNVLETWGIVQKIGGGITELHPKANKSVGFVGPLDIEPGDGVMHRPIINEKGEYVKACLTGEINGKFTYVLPSSEAVGIIKKNIPAHKEIIETVS